MEMTCKKIEFFDESVVASLLLPLVTLIFLQLGKKIS